MFFKKQKTFLTDEQVQESFKNLQSLADDFRKQLQRDLKPDIDKVVNVTIAVAETVQALSSLVADVHTGVEHVNGKLENINWKREEKPIIRPEKNIEEYIAYLQMASDKYAKTKNQKNAITAIITNIRNTAK